MSTIDERVHARLLAGGGDAADDRIAELVREEAPLLGAPDVARVVAGVEARLVGIGALQPILADAAVTDVMVNGPGPVWIERDGRLRPTPIELTRPEIDLLVEQIVAPLGLRVDPVSPVVDARLPDGSRVHVVVPPLAVDGPYVTIRRFATRAIALDDMATREVAALLRWAVRARANIVVSGATGSGKTTLLNALGREIAPETRVVTVEDAAELRLPSEHVVRLEGRPSNAEGAGAVSARDLVRSALRMRPDRLIIGEVRGEEAFDLLQAMNTGHDGSLSTVHANGSDDAVDRLEMLVLLAGTGLPADAVRAHLASAVDLIVHVGRDGDGRRGVHEVAELVKPGAGVRGGGRSTRLLASQGRVVAAPARDRLARVAGEGSSVPALGRERAA